MDTQPIYLGHDNSVDVILKVDEVAISLSAITRMTLSFSSTLVDSDNGDLDPIRWAKDGYDTGEVRFFLGSQTLTIAVYQAPLILYDAVNVNGIVWGYIPFRVIADPEAPEE